MKMSNMLHIAVDHEGAILNKLKSVRRQRGTGTKYKELVPSCSSSPCVHQKVINFWNSKIKTARPFEFLFTSGWRQPRNKSLQEFPNFEVPNFHSSWQHATTRWLPWQWCLVKEKLSPYDFQQFNISSCSKCISEHPMLVHSIQRLKIARNLSEDK